MTRVPASHAARYWIQQIGVVAILVAAFLMQTSSAQRAWSITFDETLYLNCALQTVHDGRVDKRLSESGVGPLPILLTGVPAAMTVPSVNRSDEWVGRMDDPPINAIARRLNALLIGVPLLLTVFIWLLIRRGPLAAATGGTLIAFSPTVLAHASLATTDVCSALFCTLALAALVGWFNQPDRRRFLLVGSAIGLAVASKYSGVFLFPVALILLAIKVWPQTVGTLRQRILVSLWRTGSRMTVLCLIAGTTLWATDGFSFTGPLKNVSLEDTPRDSPWIQILGDGPTARTIMDVAHRRLKRPSVVGALISRWLHNRTGHQAFLMGQRSKSGWPWYFPCAWLFKSTIPELALSLGIIPLLFVIRRRKVADEQSSQQAPFIWGIAMCVFWAMVCSAHVNIGQRYLLPLYPLTVLLAIDLLWRVWRNQSRRLIVTSVILMLGQAFSAIAVGPNYLSYFSPIVGGPRHGSQYLADSNIDWGQDLPALRQELNRLNCRRPLLEYFGTAMPEAYGINATRFASVSQSELTDHDVIAISVTSLQGVYYESDPFREFRGLKPVGYAGYSICLFDLSTPQAAEALRTAWAQFPEAARTQPLTTPPQQP